MKASSILFEVLGITLHPLGVGMIGHRLLEATKHVRPAAGECDARAFASACFVRAQRVGDDRAGVVADQSLEGLGALVVTNAMDHRAGRRQAPHLPRLGTLRFNGTAATSAGNAGSLPRQPTSVSRETPIASLISRTLVG